MEETDNAIVEQEDGKRKAGRPVGSYKVKTKDNGSFLRQGKHELDNIIKKSAKEIEKMIDVLAEIATNATNDVKERRAAAKDVLDFHVKSVEQRNKDEITRKIAEVRVRGVHGSGSTEDDDDTPDVNFGDILPEFRGNDVSDVDVNEDNS